MKWLWNWLTRLTFAAEDDYAGTPGTAPTPPDTAPSAAAQAEQRRQAVALMIEKLRQPATPAPLGEEARRKAWTPPKPPPGVIPADHAMAMDSAIDGWGSWATQNSIFAEGQMFLGYPYLAELSQRPEYRVISKTWSQEMTRKWIRVVSTGDDDIQGKTDKLKELEAELKRLGVQDAFRQAIEIDGYFGRAHIYIDTGVDSKTADGRDELKTSIGDGTTRLTKAKVRKGTLRALRVIEPVWTYPNSYNADNPLAFNFFKPTTWFVMGMEIHDTRLLTFVGRPMPDLLKPAYSFGGLSLSQMCKPYVDNWLRTRQSVSDAVSNFSIMIMLTDMAQLLNAGAALDLAQRAEFFNLARNNKGLMIADKTSEDLKNVSMPLSGLDHLQAQSQEHMASVSEIPLVVLTGISPSGLNATSEQEIAVFKDKVGARQVAECDANLSVVFNLVQLSLWGEVDPEIGYEWEPLDNPDTTEAATRRKTEMDTDVAAINAGVLSPEEVRTRIAGEEDSPYASLDLSATPEPPGQEGGEGGGLADLLGGGADPKEGEGEESIAGDSAEEVLDFLHGALLALDDAEFDEKKHPRSKDGKFGSGGGGAATKATDFHPHVSGMLKKAGFKQTAPGKYEHGKGIVIEAKPTGAELKFVGKWVATKAGQAIIHGKSAEQLKAFLKDGGANLIDKPAAEPAKSTEKDSLEDAYDHGAKEFLKGIAAVEGYTHNAPTDFGYVASKPAKDGKQAKLALITKGPNAGTWVSDNGVNVMKSGTGGPIELVKLLSGKVPTDVKNHHSSEFGATVQALFKAEPVPAKKPDASTEAHKTWKALSKGTPSLSPKESQALNAYTGSSYTQVNAGLRNDPDFHTSSTVAKHLTEAIDKCSLPEEAVLYRGIGSAMAKQLKSVLHTGGSIIDYGFMSMSTRLSTAANSFGGGLLFHITVPKGSKVISGEHGSHPSECELIAQRGSIMKITKLDRKAGIAHVTLEQPGLPETLE